MLTAQIPMSGYAPGQTIDISGELNNTSNVTVNEIHFTLKKTITYFAESPSYRVKKQISNVAEASSRISSAEGCKNFKKALLIPAVAPTNVTQSKVIHQIYELIVEIRVSGCHKHPSMTIPVIIGTVPLRQQPETALLFPTPVAPPLDHNGQENTNLLELREFYQFNSIIF
jgi:Arrestin (or S-antigen), C-terminal domain